MNYHDEPPVNEKEAINAGVAIIEAKWDGNSDFDKGMRLLQQHLKVRKKRQPKTKSQQSLDTTVKA